MGFWVYGFRVRKRFLKAVVLVCVLLLVPALSLVAVQGGFQGRGLCPLFYQVLRGVDGSAGQPVLVKADLVWGDETFSNTSSYGNMEIVLNGNLTVASGGVLRFTNVTLRVNCSLDGEHRIEVQSGGAFYINDTDGDPSTRGDASNITAYNTSSSFLFWVDSGATFQMNNSELHYCGFYSMPGVYSVRGLWINANNTIVENNTFSNNYYGMILDNAYYSTIGNNNFTDNEWEGLVLYYSSNNSVTGNWAVGGAGYGFDLISSGGNTLVGNTAIGNWYGFWLVSSPTTNNTLTGNTAIGNLHGFVLRDNANNNNLTGNVAANNSHPTFEDYGFWLDSCSNNNFTGNTAINSEYGFFVNASSNNNDLFGNDAVNCSVQGYYLGAGCVGNDFSGSVVSNFLRIRVVDLNGVGVSGVDVRVASGGVVVYASPGYGGSNESTGADGLTGWFAVAYLRYSGVSSSALKVEAWAMSYGYRVVDMSSSHTETFSETESLLPLMVFLAASQGSQGVPTVLVIGGVFGVVFAGLAVALYMLRRRA